MRPIHRQDVGPAVEPALEGPITRIPLEVLHHIIGLLAVHIKHNANYELKPLYHLEEAVAKANLVACSSVSRLLRLVALPHLFHTVAFWIRHFGRKSTSHDCSLEPEGDFTGCRTILSFRALVVASPSICRYVRDLRIGADRALSNSAPRFDLVEFLGLLHRLPSLRAVELDIVNWRVRRELDTLPRLRYPLFLERLSIVGGLDWYYDDSDTITRAHLAPLLKQLGGVGTLIFRQTFFQDLGELQNPYNIDASGNLSLVAGLREPVLVSSLIFDQCCHAAAIATDFDDGSALAFAPEALNSLVICFLHWEVPRIAHTLSVLGANLKFLAVEFQSPLGDEPWFDNPVDLGLHSCPALRRLTLDWSYDEIRPGSGPTPLCSILSSLRGHKDLQVVTFLVRCDAHSPCDIWLDPDFMGTVEDELLLLESVCIVVLRFDILWLSLDDDDEAPVTNDQFNNRYAHVVFRRLFAKGVLRIE